jgi:hypothetical protein
MMEEQKSGTNSGLCGKHPLLFLLLPLAFLFLFFSFGCVAQASSGPADIWPVFINYWAPWQRVIYIALMIGAGIVALAWMYARTVRDDKMVGWCKGELMQLAYTVLILIASLALVSALSGSLAAVSRISLAGGAEAQSWQGYVLARCAPTSNALYDRPCHIRLAEDYLQILASATTAQAETVLNYNSVLAEASSIGLSFRGMPDPAGNLDIAPLAGLSVPLETLGFVFDIANKNLMVIRFQQFLLEFLHLAFFPLFLTLGLFLRTLYFTRKLGGLLIAIALGAYIVYPMMFVFFQGMLFSFTGPWPAPAAGETDAYVERVGQTLYPISVDMGGTQLSPTKPVPDGPGYNEPAGGGFGGVKGQYSANGQIEPWEECNEWKWSVRTGTGQANAKAFGCPPSDANGNPLPGRERDYYCNPNNARCTSDPSKGYGVSGPDSRDSAGKYLTPFRQQFVGQGMSGGQRQDIVNAASALSANLCWQNPSTPQQAADERAKSRALMFGAAKSELEKLKEGWGGAIRVALYGDELLGYNGVIDNVAKIMIFSLIAPFIAIMVMLAFIKVLSPLLGGDVEIAGLTKLI